MFRRHQSAAFLRVEIDRSGLVEEFNECRARVARAAAGHHQRTARTPDDGGGPLDVVGVGRNAPLLLRRQELLQHQRVGHVLAQHVGWNLHVHGARHATVALRHGEGLVHVAQHVVRDTQRAREARDRPHDLDVRNALQRAEIVLRARCATADQQHRNALEVRVRHRGHAIRHAGPGGHHGDADAARQHGVSVRHVNRRALVAHVDDAHTALGQAVPDRLYVTALQAEYTVDAACDEKVHDAVGHRSSACRSHGLHLSVGWPVRRSPIRPASSRLARRDRAAPPRADIPSTTRSRPSVSTRGEW